MRTVVTIILYGLALGLGALGVLLTGYGWWQDHSLFTTDQGLAALGTFIAGARYVMAGLSLCVVALALAVAGGRAQRA